MYEISAWSKDGRNLRTNLDPQVWYTGVRYVADTVTMARDRETGKNHHVSYFRIFQDSRLIEVHITKYGRESGIRNWQTVRPYDDRPVILGAPADPRPYLIHTNQNRVVHLVRGEGELFGISCQWGLEILATATKGSPGWSVTMGGATAELPEYTQLRQIRAYLRRIGEAS